MKKEIFESEKEYMINIGKYINSFGINKSLNILKIIEEEGDFIFSGRYAINKEKTVAKIYYDICEEPIFINRVFCVEVKEKKPLSKFHAGKHYIFSMRKYGEDLGYKMLLRNGYWVKYADMTEVLVTSSNKAYALGGNNIVKEVKPEWCIEVPKRNHKINW